MTVKKSNNPDGRPIILNKGKAVTVYLDTKSVEFALKIGKDNISAGIRKALILAERFININEGLNDND